MSIILLKLRINQTRYLRLLIVIAEYFLYRYITDDLTIKEIIYQHNFDGQSAVSVEIQILNFFFQLFLQSN